MSIAVTRTKVILPRRRADLLSRPRLLRLLYNLLDYKLIILAAPAGYGKTSLLIDFAHQQADLPVCWYALDPLDRDPQRFIAHFIAAIAQRFPSFGNQSTAVLDSASQGSLDFDSLVTSVVNDAYEHIQEHFILVLDDYHLLNDSKEIETFINRFIQEVDENCHLILSSRALLTLPDMPLMVARSQVAGLSFEELAFRAEEIQNLILQNYHMAVPEPAAAELAKETEGWITGLLLSAQSMWQGMADRLRVARVSGVGLYDYLAQQVLDQQPREVRDFLLQTSFLEEFDISLCEAVFGPNKSWPILFEAILLNNLFVLSTGEDGRWIRYHHLFRDFLQTCFEQEYPEEKAGILHRLAAAYADRGEWEKAYDILKRLDDAQAVTILIERAGPALMKSGRLGLLAGWIDALQSGVIVSLPGLLSLRGALWVMQGQIEQGADLLTQAEAAFRANGDRHSLARTLVRRAVAHRFLGHYPQSLADATETLSLIEEDQNLSSVRAEALRAAGMCYYYMGQLGAAIEYLSRALDAYKALDDRQNVATVLMELGIADMGTGRYHQAFNHYNQALVYWREVNNPIGQATLLNNLGVLHQLTGKYEQAGSLFEQALSFAKQSGYLRMEAYILCSIGDLYFELDARGAAQEAYHQSREVAQKIDYRFLLFYLDLAECAIARQTGDYKMAWRLLKSAEGHASESGTGYEQGLWRFEAGRLDLETLEIPEASEELTKAVQAFNDGGQHVEAARSYLYLARALYQKGNALEAIDKLGHAFRLASTLESRHTLVVAGRGAKPVIEAALQDPLTSRQASRLLKQVSQFEESIPNLRRRLRPHTTTIPFAPPKLTIRAFGKTQVELDGEAVTVPEWQNQRRAREFFFCLLTHPEGLRKEEIGLIFWPDSSPEQLKLQFKNTIYRLRRALGQDVVLFDEYRYWFNHNLDYEYDVETFSEKIAQAQTAGTVNEKKSAYLAAIDVYKGSYLPDADGSWVWPERERLWQMYVEAALSLARIYLENGEYGATLEHCQRILAEDRTLEEAHRLVMSAYAAKGNQAAMSRQYERCRQALLEEVNAQPSRQTEMLYESLKI